MKVCSAIGFVFIFLLGEQVRSTHGRRALEPAANVGHPVKVIRHTAQVIADVGAPPCQLNIQNDLPKPNDPQPLYLEPTTEQIWFPGKRGMLEIPHGSSVELYCSAPFANATALSKGAISQSARVLRPVCVKGQTFQWQDQTLAFREFLCTQPVPFVVEELDEDCGGTGRIYRVGHNISATRFVETMRVCYDSQVLRNHYTKHRLQAGNSHFQRFVNRLQFSKAGHFPNLDVNSFYTQRNQKRRALKLLGSDAMVAKLFPGREVFLARGHLAAKSDAVYANQQRSSFIFHNVAPQWQSFNAGQWGRLEIEVRNFVNRADLDVDCYTGTWGTLHIGAQAGDKVGKPFFLGWDDKRKTEVLPVPKLFYRVIVDRRQPRRGIALIGVNNPHATPTEILESFVICKDVAGSVPWLRWIQNDNLETGYLYACRVDELQRAVAPNLPEHLNEVVEILV